jgi:hypothetical protein
VVQSGYCLIFFITRSLKISVENDILLPHGFTLVILEILCMFCQSVISTLSLFMFCICSWGETRLCVHSRMFCSVEFCEVYTTLLVFQYNSPTISIAETIYRMHVGVFFICKCIFGYDHAAVQHSHTSLDGVQAGISYSSSSFLY